MRILTAMGLGVLLSSAPLLAGDEALEICKQADAATKALRSVAFDVEVADEPAAGEKRARGKGRVMLEVMDKDEMKARYHITMMGTDGKPTSVVGFDGKVGWRVEDSKKKILTSEDEDDAAAMATREMGLIMVEYIHPTPFQDEINADTRTLEGEKTIGDVACNVVLVKYANDQGSARWYFGKQDNLPRRVERIGSGGLTSWTLTNFKAKPDIAAATFAVPKMEGYEVAKFEAPKRERQEPQLIAVGTAAPDWTLKTHDNKDVKLSDLKGKVVVLDFWAVWCGPCKVAMPHVEELHKKYKDKGVLVYGVNTWESEENDPAKFMSDKGYTYGLLMKGDEVATAYRVSGIPTFYIIGHDGKVAFTKVGAGDYEGIEKAINAAIKARDEQ